MFAESAEKPGISLESLAADNPFPLYEEMRDHYPVYWMESDGMWALTRYDDIKFALERPDLFSSSGQKALLQPDWMPEEYKKDLFITTQDPPEHKKNRALFTKAFAGKAVQSLVPFMQEAAEAQIAKIQPSIAMNFIDDFARPYICGISDRIVGADSDKYLTELGRWVQLNKDNLSNNPDPQYVRTLLEAINRQIAIFDKIIQERRANPLNDLASSLIQGKVNGKSLTDRQLRNALELVVTAGFYSPTQMFCRAIIQLARDPAMLQKLKAEPGKIPAFIEELLRHTAVVRSLLKRTLQPVELHGTVIPEGELVILLFASANHDPAQFPNPTAFDISRPNIKQHIAFGHGIHLCIGAELARQQLRIALESILARFNEITVPPDSQIKTANTWVMRIVEHLPVTFR